MSMTQVLDCSSKLSPTKGDQLVKACGTFQEFADNREISKHRTLGFIFLTYSTFQDTFYYCPLVKIQLSDILLNFEVFKESKLRKIGWQYSSLEFKLSMKQALIMLTGVSSETEHSHSSYRILLVTQQIWGWRPDFQKYNSKQSTFWQTAKVKTTTSLI